MGSKEFRQRAEECEQMARESADLFTKEAMTVLATEFRDEARFLNGKKETIGEE